MHNWTPRSLKKGQIFIHIQGVFISLNKDTIGLGATQKLYEGIGTVGYQREPCYGLGFN
jgi:hypothetical protein